MDEEQNVIPSSEDTDAEIITGNIGEIVEAPTINSENECRINCTDNQSLRNIIGITLNKVEGLVDSCNLKDKHSEFISVFSESFKNALEENVLVDGLPLMIDKSQKLSSPERDNRLSMVDDVLFGKLSKKVAGVAHKRKFFPEQCCRILNMKMKHEIQNLKKAKVTDSSLPSRSSVTSSNMDKTQLKGFSDFCQSFNTMQETVQCKLQEKEKLTMKIELAKEIETSQRLCLKSNKIDQIKCIASI